MRKKYRAYFRNGKYNKTYLEADTLKELTQMIIENGVYVYDYPKHYWENVLKADEKQKDGCICSWGNLEIKKGEDQMTEYTSF